MKTLSYTLCAVLAAGFAFTGDAQVKPKSKKVTELKFSGRIQGQWDGIGSDQNDDDRNHFYFRRLFLGGHAKMGDNWGGDIVLDFAASPNSETSKFTVDGEKYKTSADQVFIDGASVWYKSGVHKFEIGQKKVPFGLEETTSSSKTKAIERSVVNRQFAEQLKFNARHTGLFSSASFDSGLSYKAAVVNSGQNHNSKDSKLKGGQYGYDRNELSYYGQLAYANYDSDITYNVGAAIGQMALDESNDLTAYNLFASLGFGKFVLDAEYMSGDAEQGATDHEHEGYSIQGSYALSNAPYGSWELVYRYSTVENTDGLVSAKEIVRRANYENDEVAEIDQHYFGVNYLFNGHDAKLMLGYEMNDLTDTNGLKNEELDGFRARVQFLF